MFSTSRRWLSFSNFTLHNRSNSSKFSKWRSPEANSQIEKRKKSSERFTVSSLSSNSRIQPISKHKDIGCKTKTSLKDSPSPNVISKNSEKYLLVNSNRNEIDQRDAPQCKRAVSSDEEGMRLDRWIRKVCTAKIPQSLIQRLLRKDEISLEKHEKKERISANHKVALGQTIWFPKKLMELENSKYQSSDSSGSRDNNSFHQPMKFTMEEVHSWLIYKDSMFIAINKPTGLACQGGIGIKEHVDKYLPYLQYDYLEKPRLVHRLDRDASGVLLLGRTRTSTIYLQSLFRNHRNLLKTYWAFVLGKTKKSGTIRATIEKSVIHGEEKVIVKDTEDVNRNAKPSLTRFKNIYQASNVCALLALYPETGRTHQLRVVCASILKAPILGDIKYGSHEQNMSVEGILGTNRLPLHLHARKITFFHPELSKKISIVAPIPSYFKKTIEAFGFNEKQVNDNLETHME